MFLTKNSTPIFKWIVALLGVIMNVIFMAQVKIGIPNIGLCIILFTIVIYLLMTPLTVQQQRYSKLSAKMNPELQAIQKKYGDKKNDQVAMTKMNEETQAVYSKYGVNPMGSCLQLIIQMPILFALYRVIWNVPAYVTHVYNAFKPVAQELLNIGTKAEEFMETAAGTLSVNFKEMTMDTLVDVLYKFKADNWSELAETFPDLSSVITSTQKSVDNMNYFLGLNIAESPWTIMRNAFTAGSVLLIIGAVLVPVLAALTQWLNAKLATVATDPSTTGGNTTQDTTAGMMRSMNTVMPLMSAFFCLTLPVGMGIYWIAGAVIRSIQQVIINRYIDRMDLDEIAQKNKEKAEKKRAKNGAPQQQRIAETARMNTKNIESSDSGKKQGKQMTPQERSDKMKASTEYYQNTTKAKPGSLTAKAQMVQQYNEKNRKK